MLHLYQSVGVSQAARHVQNQIQAGTGDVHNPQSTHAAAQTTSSILCSHATVTHLSPLGVQQT